MHDEQSDLARFDQAQLLAGQLLDVLGGVEQPDLVAQLVVLSFQGTLSLFQPGCFTFEAVDLEEACAEHNDQSDPGNCGGPDDRPPRSAPAPPTRPPAMVCDSSQAHGDVRSRRCDVEGATTTGIECSIARDFKA